MTDITHDGEGFIVPAELLAEALHLTPADVPDLLAKGTIKTVSEEGVGSDEGRFRLSFTHANRRLRLVVEADGTLITRSVVDYGKKPAD